MSMETKFKMETETPRTIKELLQVLLDNKQCFKIGLCYWTYKIYIYNLITEKEYTRLIHYINSNKPKYKWYNIYMILNCDNDFFWRKDCIIPRIKWLKYHISIN